MRASITSILTWSARDAMYEISKRSASKGGVLAKKVAGSLKALCESHQVICITHLHQIASVADHHILVYKEPKGKRTVTRARRVSGKELVEEISRMLGDTSDISRRHAEELLAGRKK